MSARAEVIIYTDGACSRNPGPGGWGLLLMSKGVARYRSGFAEESTNNRMELQAAIEAFKTLTRASSVELHTDSKYLKDGIEKWIHGWKRRNWKTSENKQVQNLELWLELDALVQLHEIQWFWVRGHANDRYNNFVDKLATEAIVKRVGVDKKLSLNELERKLDVR